MTAAQRLFVLDEASKPDVLTPAMWFAPWPPTSS